MLNDLEQEDLQPQAEEQDERESPICVDWDDSKLKELAIELAREIRDGLAPELLRTRWARHDDLYQNKILPPRDDLPQASNYPVPTMEPKISVLIGNNCGGMTQKAPFFTARLNRSVDESTKEVEDDVHMLLEMAEFRFRNRMAGKHAALYGKGIYRITPNVPTAEDIKRFRLETIVTNVAGGLVPRQRDKKDSKPPFGAVWDVIHPTFFSIYPVTVDSIVDAKTTADIFYRRRAWIKEQMKIGEFKSYEASEWLGGTKPPSNVGGRDEAHTGTSPIPELEDDRQPELAQGITYRDLNEDGYEEPYYFVIDVTNELIYSLKEYKYSRPWYFDVFFDVDIGENGFWWPNSPAYNLQGLHLIKHYLINDFLDALDMYSFPPIFVPDAIRGGDNKNIKYKKGELIELDTGTPPVTPTRQVNLEVFPLILQIIDALADASIKISVSGAGGIPITGTTATATSLAAAGQNQAADEYYANFVLGHIPAIKFVCEIMATHFGPIKEIYRDQLRVDTAVKYARPYMWEATGQSPLTSPQAVMNAAMALMNLMADSRSGIDPYQLAAELIDNSPLRGNPRLQITLEQMQQARIAALEETQASLSGEANGEVPTQPGRPA